jgi:hypothetical protein
VNNRYYLRIKGSDEYYFMRVGDIYIARFDRNEAYNGRTGGHYPVRSRIPLLKQLVIKRVL